MWSSVVPNICYIKLFYLLNSFRKKMNENGIHFYLGQPAVNFPFLDGDVPRSPSYGVSISQLIRFARVCFNVSDFNNRNIFFKLLEQGYRYHKLRKSKGAKDQESRQLSATTDLRHHMGKLQKTRKHRTQASKEYPVINFTTDNQS